MKITTKMGDGGVSGLFNGKRLKKDDNLFDLLGDIDELSAFLGWTKSELIPLCIKEDCNIEKVKKFLSKTLDDLYLIMSFCGFEFRYPENVSGISEKDLSEMEILCEYFKKNIDPISGFVRPGKGKVSSSFHVLRTICRRAERSFVRAYSLKEPSLELKYLNRLSDVFFVFALYFQEEPSSSEGQ
ncbi:MAG: cob(I)yrinic acid a,c-diamide adenosyltransferase [Candidatus Gracilibacteria bacterium]|jgi:cob(I)alamin adenosyltransferase|nr:cob(I)yrinic acid a,c-diamide adenosyltransferase [Candidatus Gracilibacteria bacterium]